MRRPLFKPVLLLALTALTAAGQQKKPVHSAADLPQFRFPLNQPASRLLAGGDRQFAPLTRAVATKVDWVLAHYSISDAPTLRQLLGARLDAELLQGHWAAALATARRIRGLEVKPAAKLTSGLLTRALATAAERTGASRGPAFQHAYQAILSQELKPLPWAVTQNALKRLRLGLELVSPNLLIGSAQHDLDPQVAKTGGLDLPSAARLLSMRTAEKVEVPLAASTLAILQPYIATHTVQKPNIWRSRDVVLDGRRHLTPVRIAIFDSGVDTSLYPGRLFIDRHPDGHSPHGLAFDVHGRLDNADLQPLTAQQKAAYPEVLAVFQGLDDLQNGIDSQAAAAARAKLSRMPPARLAAFLKQVDFLGQYLHGTHVAGIAVRGNPAARLVVVQFYDSLPDIPFPPSIAWAETFQRDFQQIGTYLRRHHVRVVNMSWGDNQREFEQWLDKTSTIQDPTQRKRLAGQIYTIWRQGIREAIQAAPQTLWICAAGNSDSNASFEGDVPASLQLPNLIAVGAVDQAGEETGFTSFGKTVPLYADGYEVNSFVPGGRKLRLSGTSMASPNVVNLAAKLIALDPQLTPAETIALMEKGATRSRDGRLRLIDPQSSVQLLDHRMRGQRRGRNGH